MRPWDREGYVRLPTLLSTIAVSVLVVGACHDSAGLGGGDDDGGAGADAGGDATDGHEIVARWQPPAGPMPQPTDYWQSSDSVDRLVASPGVDATQKVDGSVEYADDLDVADVKHVKICRSTVPHGIVESIDATQAERTYRRYLDSLEGFPTTVDARFPVDGNVDPESLEEHVFAYDASNSAALEVTPRRASDGSIEVDFDAGELAAGNDYAVVVRGGAQGVRSVGGAPLVADRAFRLLRRSGAPSEADVDWDVGGSDPQAVAGRLAALGPDYDSTFAWAAQRHGVARPEVAAATEFRTSAETFLEFDLESGEMPIPNAYLRETSDGTVRLPERPDDSAALAELKSELDTYNGFSTSGALFARATGPVESSTLDEQSLRVFRHDSRAWTRIEGLASGRFETGQTVWTEPRPALEPDTEYAFVVTDGLEDVDGEAIRAPPPAAMIRADAPLVDGRGTSRLSAFSDEEALQLERVRERAGGLVTQLEQQGLSRESLASVVPFRTLDVLEGHFGRRARLYREDVPTSVTETTEKSPAARGLFLAMPRVETVVTGKMTTLDFLNPKTREFRADGKAETRQVDFVLTIPRGYDKSEEIPVVLFGHGLMTSRELAYLIADRLARAGFAVFAMDLPYHGRRSICLSDASCRGDASCDATGQCIEPDGSTGELRSAEAPDWLWTDSPEYPVTTGLPFVELDNLVAARDHFAQAMVDLMQGLRVVRGADWRSASSGWSLDGDDVVYFGMSLGGILGANLAAVEPTIGDFALNVPGGDFVELISASKIFRGAFEAELQERGIEEGSDAYLEFMHRAHWILDPVDPMNLARYARERSARYRDPRSGEMKQTGEKRMLIQMADGDSIMPNSSTRILSERSGVPISTYEPAVSDHGFVFDPTSVEGADARDEIAEFLKNRR